MRHLPFYLPSFGRKMYCPRGLPACEALSEDWLAGWRADFCDRGATGGRRLRMDARLPVLQLIQSWGCLRGRELPFAV